ncbi:abortive infection bacteriophage resistance protein [Saccharopolyspora lacisalsi]|uniref:Abortive infection bacteriophage resistance protein n=1 Tax=Halosaccharopolyspora lacisalsi TaxID=1000566 RepID=A0A839E7X7_9PSEU|nr:Abi family protein [Halosaccharopolyspora lacisalsi]MBA8827807.1 abortive infection bacteriophage resistance protein [Halosaccharopolyspora lacisalsi]
MPASYTKPHLDLPAQVQLLSSRGLSISDSQHAQRVLRTVGYYRLSGYWYPYRQPDPTGVGRADDFLPGTSFDQIVGLYDFDRRLKLHLLDALERIEIAVRVQLGDVLGRRSAYAHLDPTNLDPGFDKSPGGKPSRYQEWLRRMQEAQQRSREDFVKHFRTKYDGWLPTWVVTEILDFGGVSTLYSGLQRRDRDEIAADLGALDATGAGNGSALKNWLQVINYLRNTCAHHSRLWNRNMDVQLAPKHLGPISRLAHLHTGPPTQLFRVFGPLCLVLFLLAETTDDDAWQQWRASLLDLLTTALPPTGRDLVEMGFPLDWRTWSLWR